jgi:putative flippase GtrA
VSIAAFALVGAASTLIDVGAFWLLTDAGQLPPLLANAIGYCLGGLNSFALNDGITFRQRGGDARTLRRLARFAAARALCLVASSLFLAAALQLMPPLAAKALAVAMTFLLAYTLASRLVFR